MWMAKGEFLGDESAHGQAEHESRLDSRRVQHGYCVIGHLGYQVWTARRLALSDTPVVENDDPEATGQAGFDVVPHPGGITQAHDQ
jgi:hypothetical protein